MNNKIKIILIKIGISFSILIIGIFIKTAIGMAMGHSIIIAWLGNALVLFPALAGFFYVWTNYPFDKNENAPRTEKEKDKNEHIKKTSVEIISEQELVANQAEHEEEKSKLSDSQNPQTSSMLIFGANKKINFSYTAEKIAKYCGGILILIIIVNGCSELFGNKLLFPWEMVVFIPVLFLFIEIFKGEFSRPANKISIDLEKRILYLNYTSYFFINRKYQSGFNDIKINCSNKKSGAIEKITFINSDMETICYVDSREELFSEEDFNMLSKKLNELTFYKNQ